MPRGPPGGGEGGGFYTNFIITEPIETKFGTHIHDPNRSTSCRGLPLRGTPLVPPGGLESPSALAPCTTETTEPILTSEVSLESSRSGGVPFS